jgi:acetyl esterase/lipase
MTLLFLLFSIASALLTLNVYFPRMRGKRAVGYSFIFGWTWGELAPHVILAHAVIVALFAAGGALDTSAGQFALVLSALSCGALGYGYLESEKARDEMERALREGFGEDFENEIEPEFVRQFERGTRWKELVRPFKMRHPDVEVIRDIVFDRQKGVDLKLDVYRHRSMPKDCPVLLQIHGGAWVIGDKREQALPLMNQMASRGWLCISANYRLSPHATFPEHIVDVKSAIRWIRERGREYGANPEFLAVTGGSAGGHLSSLAALTAGDASLQPGFEYVDTSVSACVPFYGVYDFTNRYGYHQHDGFSDILERHIIKGSTEEKQEIYRQASPMDRIGEQRPSFCVVHGDLDSLAPVGEARRFVEMLRSVGEKPVVYAEIPKAQHAFEIFKSVRSQAVVDGVERYLAREYSCYLRARRGPHDSAGDAPASESTGAGGGDDSNAVAASRESADVEAAASLNGSESTVS